MFNLRILAVLAAATVLPTQAIAQTTVESVPNYARAQFIQASDLSPEEYQRLLNEADKVRSYQSATTVAQPYVTSTTQYVPSTTTINQPTIEIFDAPIANTSSYSAYNTTYGSTATTMPASTTITTGTSYTGHSVVKGDTLYSISKRYGVSLKDLKSTNGKTGNALSIGEYLQIPGAYATYQPATTSETSTRSRARLVRTVEPIPASDVYAVLPGDTFYSISRQACLSVGQLSSVNGQADINALQPGQRLNLPSGHCLR